MPSDTETTYCHVCLGDVPTCKVAKCPNGHACCEKHHIQRIKAIYEGGQKAFGDDPNERIGQRCFMCRAIMPGALFSERYFRMLRITQAVEVPKQVSGRRMTNEGIVEILQALQLASAR